MTWNYNHISIFFKYDLCKLVLVIYRVNYDVSNGLTKNIKHKRTTADNGLWRKEVVLFVQAKNHLVVQFLSILLSSPTKQWVLGMWRTKSSTNSWRELREPRVEPKRPLREPRKPFWGSREAFEKPRKPLQKPLWEPR